MRTSSSVLVLTSLRCVIGLDDGVIRTPNPGPQAGDHEGRPYYAYEFVARSSIVGATLVVARRRLPVSWSPAFRALTATKESPSLPVSALHDGPGNAFRTSLLHTTTPIHFDRAG